MIKKILIGLILVYVAVAGTLNYFYTEKELKFKYDEFVYNWNKNSIFHQSAMDRIRKCNEKIEIYREGVDSIFNFVEKDGENYIRVKSIELFKVGISSINMEFYYIDEAVEASKNLKFKEYTIFIKEALPAYKKIIKRHYNIIKTFEKTGLITAIKNNKLHNVNKIIQGKTK